MKKNQFTEKQIACALHEVEGGTPVTEICRKLGVSEQTFCRWKRKFAGMGVTELRRLRQLEEEKRKLKQLVADLSLDKHKLQEVIRKSCKAGSGGLEKGCWSKTCSTLTATGLTSGADPSKRNRLRRRFSLRRRSNGRR